MQACPASMRLATPSEALTIGLRSPPNSTNFSMSRVDSNARRPFA